MQIKFSEKEPLGNLPSRDSLKAKPVSYFDQEPMRADELTSHREFSLVDG